MAAERAHNDPLGGGGLRAVAGPGPSIALGQSPLEPVGGARHAAREAPGLNNGFQSQPRMAEAGRPLGTDPTFSQ